jgi:uncharacterized protein (TIGR00369 family)
VRVARAALAPGVVVAVEIDGSDYVVWRGHSGRLGSAPRSCPHLDHDLAAGFVVGDELVCPGHAWAFDGHGRVHKRNEFGRVDPKGQVSALTLREDGDGIEVESYSRPLMSTIYPPDRHLLRDLRLTFEHDADDGHRTSRAWMPIVAELCASDGTVRAGALATLVDVIGGGLAATVAHPNWIATADLTLHLAGSATHGSVEARARVAHAGRTTVVIEVDLYDHTGPPIGIATMSFAVLPHRDDNPDITTSMTAGPSTIARVGSGLRASLLDELEIRVTDGPKGEIEAPIGEWSRNSLGAMQGGAVAILIDAAATAASTAAAAEPVVVTDLQLTYLALARVGPLRTRADVLSAAAGTVITRVELIDTGADRRVTTLARVVASPSLTVP